MKTMVELQDAKSIVLNQIDFAKKNGFPTLVVDRFEDDLAEVNAQIALLKYNEKQEIKSSPKEISFPELLNRLEEMLKLR